MLPAVVLGQAYLGSHRDYIVDIGQELLIAAPSSLNIPAGSRVKVRVRAERCRGIIRLDNNAPPTRCTMANKGGVMRLLRFSALCAALFV